MLITSPLRERLRCRGYRALREVGARQVVFFTCEHLLAEVEAIARFPRGSNFEASANRRQRSLLPAEVDAFAGFPPGGDFDSSVNTSQSGHDEEAGALPCFPPGGEFSISAKGRAAVPRIPGKFGKPW